MYNINDAVIYAAYGVCRIIAVEEREFGGETAEYYVLQPVRDSRTKLFVPVNNAEAVAKLRPVLSKEEVEALIKVMPDEELMKIEDGNQRKELYRNILSEGDHHKIVQLIKTLYLHKNELLQQHKKLHSADERCLEDAEKLLYDEFSYALGIPREEVLPYIISAIGK